jgi:hypothetical protein
MTRIGTRTTKTTSASIKRKKQSRGRSRASAAAKKSSARQWSAWLKRRLEASNLERNS